jgi:FkbM family methyltransferase
MLNKIVALLPKPLLDFLLHLKEKNIVLKKLVSFVARRASSVDQVIRGGVGKGLKFNATGGFSGLILGTLELDEQQHLADSLSTGNVFYDIGANIGFYSTIAARICGEGGYVYAFEPIKESADRARSNAYLNNFNNVEVLEIAISDEVGEVRFAVGDSSVCNHIKKTGEDSCTDLELVIPCSTIDNLIAEKKLRPPSVIMIDIEGAEFHAIRGMQETLKKYHPTIIMEVHWLIEEFRQTYEEILQPLGYSVRTLDGSPLPTEPVRYHVIYTPS